MSADIAKAIFEEHTPGTWYVPVAGIIVTDMRTVGVFLAEYGAGGPERATLRDTDVNLACQDIEYLWGYAWINAAKTAALVW